MKTKLLKSLLLLLAFAISIQLQAQTESPRKALSFDGVNDYVSGTGISTSLTAFTIEAWVYHNRLPQLVVQRYVTIQPEVAVLRYDGSASGGGTNELHFYIKNASGSLVGLRVDNVLSYQTWMHIAGTYDGTTMKLYLNGRLLKSGAAVGLSAPSGSFSFSDGGSEAFNGKLDEVSVWNYARAMADIREDMYRTAPIANANLLNYWQFNNGTGTTLTDLKGTATGTLNNMDNSNWIASTIPFAAGAVNTQIVNATGTKTFTGTGLAMNFTAKSGTDTIVASRIDTLANVSPTGVPTVFNSQYWVVKRFGSGTYTSNLTFTLSEDLTATDESLPANISLYARADYSDASWTLLATATSANAANNTATFNGITGFSQFIVAKECVNPTNGGTIAGDQTGCNPFDPAAFTSTALPTGQSGTLEYKWQKSTTSSSAGFSDIAGSNAATYDAGSLAQTTWYKRLARVSCKTDWTGAVESNVLQISTAIGSQSTAGQSQTLNGTFTPITVTAIGSNVTYQWYKNATASNSGGTSLGTDNGAQTNSYTPQATIVGTLYYYCVVNGDFCPALTTAVSGAFQVNPIAIAPAGSGTTGDPYQIANLNNLYWLSTNSGYWNMNYIQTADINASQTRIWNSGSGFSPIGNGSVFRGTYNGKGHIIDSLYINRPNNMNVGLFGYIRPSSLSTNAIDSLSLTNIDINGMFYVGGIAGAMYEAIMDHCSVSGSIVCSNYSSSYYGSGGLIGQCRKSRVNYCYSSVNVNCNNMTPPHMETQYIGSLMGESNESIIKQCYSYGLVTASPSVFGASGFIGWKYYNGTVDSCYWDNVTSGQTLGIYDDAQPTTTDLHGKNTADMKTQSTYIGWDFNNVWSISNTINNGYPYFHYSPGVSTAAASNIATNTATGNGSIISLGTLSSITSHGFCWNTTGAPTVFNNKVNLGAKSTTGSFTANITGLSHNTTYYMRAFAINELDTIYGATVNFTTTNTPQATTCIHIKNSFTRVIIPDNNTLDLTNNYTIETWIKPEYFFGNRVIAWKGTDGYSLLTSNTGNFRGLNFDGMSTADNILTANQWHHVVAVNDNGTRHLYLNGVEQSLTGTANTVAANTGDLNIGNIYAANRAFRSWIEEVRLWNIPLAYSQIRELMHLSLTGSETGLVSCWQFDEGSGSTVNDKKGINNGTIFYYDNPTTNNFYEKSTIPFGNGYSNTQVVTATGTNTFTTTGLAMNFTAKTGMDSIVVARIDSFPNINPAGLNAVFDRQYWAVHKYGTGTLTANLTFTISEGFTADDQSVPTKIKLYKRGSMADDSTWVYVASASTVNATTKQATFNGITDFSQLIVARGVCSVNIPDANFRAALLAIPGLDADSDGEIQCTEAAAYTGDMDVHGKSIADLTGIEAFTNITKLYCNQNNLTSLNISALTLLTDLDCSNNQLTALNVSTNTALINFSCANNSLTSLNVSSNTSLNYLVCRFNQLTSLDVHSNSALIGLFCNNNVLTSLNVNGLTSLSNINCGVNQLTNLDFSTNTGITNLDCGYNSLTGLNVKNGNNTNMSGANFSATNNTGLSCIQVDNAAWSTTNWTNIDAGASYNTSCTPITISATVNPVNSGTITGTGDYANGQTVTLTATPEAGYIFTNWTESGTQVSTNAVYSFTATVNRTLVANFEVDAPVIPEVYTLSNDTLLSGETDCFNATQTITVAGAGTNVVFQNGSTATLIAGQSIRFLPGFHAQSGSSVHAYITTTGTFCDDVPTPIVSQPEQKSITQEETPNMNPTIEKSVKVYPNPNNGKFTVELKNFENATQLVIYNNMGQRVYNVTVTGQQHLVSLPNLQRGIYFLKAVHNEKQFDQKILVK